MEIISCVTSSTARFTNTRDMPYIVCGHMILVWYQSHVCVCGLCSLQICEMFLGDCFVGLTGVDKDKALAQVYSYYSATHTHTHTHAHTHTHTHTHLIIQWCSPTYVLVW